MRISLVQTSLIWENPTANRQMLSAKLAPLKGKTDVVVLPEMFSTGFSMGAGNLAETVSGPTVEWMRQTAWQLDAVVTGSIMSKDDYGETRYNRLVWMFPDGTYQVYDKRHLFGLADESKYLTAGQSRLVIEWKGWRICPLICYDLRFPVWSRNASADPYDLLIYVANWPSRRGHHWRTLLTARAIENQAYVAGVNIFGTDGAGLEYTGDSGLVDFFGAQLFQISDREDVVTAELSLEALQAYRRQLPFLEDADAFKLI
jgi:predicted amidohydrolase